MKKRGDTSFTLTRSIEFADRLGNGNPGGNGAWQDANSNGSGLPGQLNDFRGVPFQAIAPPQGLSGNATMATPNKFRLLVLCAGSLCFCGALGHAAPAQVNPAANTPWFDHQLSIETQNLRAHIERLETRDQLISVALLDQIYGLREQLSDPSQLDSVLSEVAGSSTTTTRVRAEATMLEALASASHFGHPDDASAKELLKWSKESVDVDCEVENAVAAISVFHQWNDSAAIGRAAELCNTAEAWYRASQAATGDDQRVQALRRTLTLDSGYVPAIIDMAREYQAQARPSRARSLLTTAFSGNPGEPSLRALLAEMDIREGHGAAALATMNELRSALLPIAVARDLADSYAQLGFLKEARELAHYALKLHPAGLEERQQTLRFDQQAADAKAIAQDHQSMAMAHQDEVAEDTAEASGESDHESERLRHLMNGKPASENESTRAFFADVSNLIDKWHALPIAARSESRTLAEVRVDELGSNYQVAQHVQQVIAVGSSADVATYRNRAIQYSPDSQMLTVSRARVHHADSQVSEADDLGETSVADISVAMYYDLQARQYRFRDLRAGDVIELEYTISPLGRENPYGHYFAELVAFGGPLKCDLQRYVLRAPGNIHLSHAEHLVPKIDLQREGNQSVFLWERKDIAALIREPGSASWSEQGAYVHVSNFDSWQALGKWYGDLVRPQFKLNPELENVVHEIVARHSNRLDLVAAIDELVLKSTRYVALEFGVYGFKPYPVTQTYARRFGDCKDKASLLVALLREAGIAADIALVRTQRLGEIDAQPASASIFDHSIVYVPEFDLWLDGTAEFSRLRELPVDDQGAMALIIDADGNAVLRRTPTSSASDNYSRRTINARIDPDGSVHFSGATYVRGEDAPELRRQLEPRDSKLGYVRDRLAQVLPAVEIRDVQSPQSPSESVSLNFNGELSTFRGRRAVTLPSSWMERNYVTTLAATNSRHQDLRLEAPWTTAEEIHIQLPTGARVNGLPENQTIRTQFGTAQLEYQLHDRELTVLSTVQFSETRVSAAQYEAFRDFAAALEEAFHRNIEVALP